MFHRRPALPLTVCVSLLLAGWGSPTRADYGVTSNRPLSNPRQARVDQSITGTWRADIKGRTYYLHVGTGNIVGNFNWTELILVNPGEKRPSFYLHHLVGFPSTIGGENYFNVAHMSKLIPQLRGSKIEQLISSVERFEILKYKLTGNHLDVWAADQKLIREAIQAGKIRGSEERVDDTAENLIKLIESLAPNLYVNKFRYTRIKEPDPPPPDKPAPVKEPSEAPKSSAETAEPAVKPQ